MTSATQATKDPWQELGAERLLSIHRTMVRARVLEERLIKMSKGGEGFFWIGGPGEEAFNVPLGLQVKKGRGMDYDWLHLHYRSSAILLAMGAKPIDAIRQMRTVATDPFSKGRNFTNHFCVPEWNVPPMSPTIETQYSTAIGSGIAQARLKNDAITIVNGGDAGTAEGDFHSCLVWANRPVLKLPILMIVVNNGYGISTPCREQHGEKHISDFGKPFDMGYKTVNGNDVVESWFAIKEAMAYVRRERKPYLLEAMCSRLHGHSSSSGANRVNEPDSIALFEEGMLKRGLAQKAAFEANWTEEKAACDAAYEQVRKEPFPKPESIWDDVFSGPLPDSYPTKGGSGTAS